MGTDIAYIYTQILMSLQKVSILYLVNSKKNKSFKVDTFTFVEITINKFKKIKKIKN